MDAKIIVTAQLEENYQYHEGGEYWKMKGGIQFEIPTLKSFLFYTDENQLIKTLKYVMKKESNEIERFTYISHDVLFQEPIKLDMDLEDLYNHKVKKEITNGSFEFN